MSKKQQRKQGVEEKAGTGTEEEDAPAIAIPSFAEPPPLETKRDKPQNDGRVGLGFSSKLVVPPNLKDVINKQERRRRFLAGKSYDSLEEALEAYDREKAESLKEPEAVVAEVTIDAGVWDGEIDESV